jgi:hypothetical protein
MYMFLACQFCKITHLQQLSVANNRLSTLQKGLSAGLESLKRVQSGVDMVQLNAGISLLSNA